MKIRLDEEDFRSLLEGQMIKKGQHDIFLADIGYAKIMLILKSIIREKGY